MIQGETWEGDNRLSGGVWPPEHEQLLVEEETTTLEVHNHPSTNVQMNLCDIVYFFLFTVNTVQISSHVSKHMGRIHPWDAHLVFGHLMCSQGFFPWCACIFGLFFPLFTCVLKSHVDTVCVNRSVQAKESKQKNKTWAWNCKKIK